MRGDKEINDISDTQLPSVQNNGHSVWSQGIHSLAPKSIDGPVSQADSFTITVVCFSEVRLHVNASHQCLNNNN